MAFHFFEKFSFGGNNFFEGGLEIWFGDGGVGSYWGCCGGYESGLPGVKSV